MSDHRLDELSDRELIEKLATWLKIEHHAMLELDPSEWAAVEKPGLLAHRKEWPNCSVCTLLEQLETRLTTVGL